MQSPKFAPPIEFVDQATLSPPEGYKDAAALSNALSGALGGGHVFGAQHIQQLQVIQRLQQQRAAMLAAARNNSQAASNTNNGGSSSGTNPQAPPPPNSTAAVATACTECAACAECAATNQDEGRNCTP